MEPQQIKTLRIQSIFLLAFLAAQYILGMYVNFYVSFPDGIQGGSAWQFAWTQAALAAHIVIGILMVLGAIIFMVRVLKYRNKRLRTTAALGLLGVLLAGIGGSAFIPSQTDAFSYLMSLAFLLAFFSYAWGYFRNEERQKNDNR